MKKIFVVSDVHGHCTLLRKALDRAGFQKNDPGHLLVCFDYLLAFDRTTALVGLRNMKNAVKKLAQMREEYPDVAGTL